MTQHGEGLLDVFYIETQPWTSQGAVPTEKMRTAGYMPADADAATWWAQWEDDQVARLTEQLAASTARWKVLVGHHGIYSYGLAHWSTPKLARLNAVARAAGVALYVSGHDHDLMAIRLPANDTNSPLYITSGAGSSTRNDVADPTGDGSLLFSYGFSGFTHFRVSEWELAATFYDMNGNVLGNLAKPWVKDPVCDEPDLDSRCSAPAIPPKKKSIGTLLGMARTWALDALELIGIQAPMSRDY